MRFSVNSPGNYRIILEQVCTCGNILINLPPFLAWLSANASDITRYLEIGCHWGGMTILTAEWLRAGGARLAEIRVVDPIEPSPFILEYFNILDREEARIEHQYLRGLSTEEDIK